MQSGSSFQRPQLFMGEATICAELQGLVYNSQDRPEKRHVLGSHEVVGNIVIAVYSRLCGLTMIDVHQACRLPYYDDHMHSESKVFFLKKIIPPNNNNN